MSPFERAHGIESSMPSPAELMQKFGLSEADAREAIKQSCEALIFVNDRYQVAIFDEERGSIEVGCKVLHLSIKRLDRETLHDWRELQEIKNALTDPEFEAIELYPAESRKVDAANQYHLWVFCDKTFRIPLGFWSRLVTEVPVGLSKQRSFNEA